MAAARRARTHRTRPSPTSGTHDLPEGDDCQIPPSRPAAHSLIGFISSYSKIPIVAPFTDRPVTLRSPLGRLPWSMGPRSHAVVHLPPCRWVPRLRGASIQARPATARRPCQYRRGSAASQAAIRSGHPDWGPSHPDDTLTEGSLKVWARAVHFRLPGLGPAQHTGAHSEEILNATPGTPGRPTMAGPVRHRPTTPAVDRRPRVTLTKTQALNLRVAQLPERHSHPTTPAALRRVAWSRPRWPAMPWSSTTSVCTRSSPCTSAKRSSRLPCRRPGLLPTLAVLGVGFVSRPLGGVVIGAYADRHGRKLATPLTIALITGVRLAWH